jgi:2-hydroxychromene-2-carboxylate isomerase
MLVDYSRIDAQRLAQRHGLWFRDPGEQPGTQRVQQAGRQLLDAIGRGDIVTRAEAISRDLWQGAMLQDAMLQNDQLQGDSTGGQPATSDSLASHLLASQALRRKQGHYLGATVLYGGEWYWGIDRLQHLERRLQSLGAQHAGVTDLLYPPGEDLATVKGAGPNPEIDFFFSFRSPYSAIVTPRVFSLARHTGARVNLRYLLPMVMRGLPVPAEKRGYIAADAAREAHWRGTPFGRVNDPVGRPTERGLALIPLAQRHDRAQAYVSAFMHGVWAEGIDAGSDRGLRSIVQRALSRDAAQRHESAAALRDALNQWLKAGAATAVAVSLSTSRRPSGARSTRSCSAGDVACDASCSLALLKACPICATSGRKERAQITASSETPRLHTSEG